MFFCGRLILQYAESFLLMYNIGRGNVYLFVYLRLVSILYLIFLFHIQEIRIWFTVIYAREDYFDASQNYYVTITNV